MICSCGTALDRRGRNRSGLCRRCRSAVQMRSNRSDNKPDVPDNLLAEYTRLVHTKRIPAADAKRMVLEAAGR